MIWQFAKAVFVGTIAGAWLPTIFTTLMALAMIGEQTDWLEALKDALFLVFGPALITFCFVLPSSIMIGLPTTAVLAWLRLEWAIIYVSVGIIAGSAVTIAVFIWMEAEAGAGWFLIVLGMFSGSVTGWIWGSERETRATHMS